MNKINRPSSIIYCRVSSKEQADEGYSLEAQEKLLIDYATKHDFEIAKIYKIAETASKHEVRKRFNEMLIFASKNKVDIILCEKIDRLTRNLKDAAVVNDWVQDKPERAVHFVKESFIVSKNTKAHENLVWDMKVAIARFYTNNLSEEVKKGQIEKLEQGWMPKQAPLGYQTIGETKHKTHIIDPIGAIYVKEIFDLYSTGLYSLRDISEHMFKKGLRSINGSKISPSNIRLTLKKTFYYGEINWNGKQYKGKHDPIISKELFNICQEIMHGGKPDKYIKHNPLFKGLVKCSNCQHKVSWYEKKGNWYGRCAQYSACVQSKMPIREDFLLEQVFPPSLKD